MQLVVMTHLGTSEPRSFPIARLHDVGAQDRAPVVVSRGVVEAQLTPTQAMVLTKALVAAWSFGPYKLKDKFRVDGAVIEDSGRFQSFVTSAIGLWALGTTLGSVQVVLLALGDSLPTDQKTHWRREVNSAVADLGAAWEYWYEPARTALLELGVEARRLTAASEDRRSMTSVLGTLRDQARTLYFHGESELDAELLAGPKRDTLKRKLAYAYDGAMQQIDRSQLELRRPGFQASLTK